VRHEVSDRALEVAQHHAEIGRPEAALAALDRVGGDALDHVVYWHIRAFALLDLERNDESAAAATEGLRLAGDDVALLDCLACAELNRDRLEAGERALRTALRQAPEHPVLLAHLTLALARQQRHDEAADVVREALEIWPDNVDLLRVRAQRALLAGEDAATVRAYLGDLLRIEPGDRIGRTLLGRVSVNEKDYRRAARELAVAARIDPSNERVAAAAREARVTAHPVLAPVRAIWRFGRWRAYLVFLLLSGTLAAAHQPALRGVVGVLWLTVVLLGRFGRPILRWRERRRYGG
jgi:tetratricopeptide (TPR) repeat protein